MQILTHATTQPSCSEEVEFVPKIRTRLREVDGLRGIAIWLVLLGHFFVVEYAKELGGLSQFAFNLTSKYGWGVDLFFVISGFLIGGILLDHRHSPALLKTFYLRRALRIFPLYFAMVLLLIGPAYLLGFPAQSRYVPFLSYIFFAQNLCMSAGLWALSAFGPLWSIAVEEQFYLFAPLLFRRASLGRIKVLLLVIILAAIAMRFVCIAVPWIDSGAFTVCRLDAIALGFFGALLMRNAFVFCGPLSVRPLRLLVALMLPLFVGIAAYSKLPVYLAPFGPTYIACFFLAVMLLAVLDHEGMLGRALRSRLLRTSGKYCYFLYLFHFTVLDNVALLIEDRLFVRLVSLGVCFLLAAISWRFVESRLIGIGQRRSYEFTPLASPRAESWSPSLTPEPYDRRGEGLAA